MDICRANKFIYIDFQHEIFYISKDINTILELEDVLKGCVYGIVGEEKGGKLIQVEYGYDNEPVLMTSILGTFVHLDYLLTAKPYYKIIEI